MDVYNRPDFWFEVNVLGLVRSNVLPATTFWGGQERIDSLKKKYDTNLDFKEAVDYIVHHLEAYHQPNFNI